MPSQFPETLCYCGQAPFITAQGTKLASYQEIGPRGTAIATVCIEDGVISDFYAVAGAHRAEFLAAAKKHFNETQALTFN